MARNRREGGRAEAALRRELLRLRPELLVQAPELPGRPDIVFPVERLCVFCDGDFWHGRHWSALRLALLRRHNSEYWIAKIQSNRARDRRVTRQLRQGGWSVVRLWETDILKNPGKSAERISRILKPHI